MPNGVDISWRVTDDEAGQLIELHRRLDELTPTLVADAVAHAQVHGYPIDGIRTSQVVHIRRRKATATLDPSTHAWLTAEAARYGTGLGEVIRAVTRQFHAEVCPTPPPCPQWLADRLTLGAADDR